MVNSQPGKVTAFDPSVSLSNFSAGSRDRLMFNENQLVLAKIQNARPVFAVGRDAASTEYDEYRNIEGEFVWIDGSFQALQTTGVPTTDIIQVEIGFDQQVTTDNVVVWTGSTEAPGGHIEDTAFTVEYSFDNFTYFTIANVDLTVTEEFDDTIELFPGDSPPTGAFKYTLAFDAGEITARYWRINATFGEALLEVQIIPITEPVIQHWNSDGTQAVTHAVEGGDYYDIAYDKSDDVYYAIRFNSDLAGAAIDPDDDFNADTGADFDSSKWIESATNTYFQHNTSSGTLEYISSAGPGQLEGNYFFSDDFTYQLEFVNLARLSSSSAYFSLEAKDYNSGNLHALSAIKGPLVAGTTSSGTFVGAILTYEDTVGSAAQLQNFRIKPENINFAVSNDPQFVLTYKSTPATYGVSFQSGAVVDPSDDFNSGSGTSFDEDKWVETTSSPFFFQSTDGPFDLNTASGTLDFNSSGFDGPALLKSLYSTDGDFLATIDFPGLVRLTDSTCYFIMEAVETSRDNAHIVSGIKGPYIPSESDFSGTFVGATIGYTSDITGDPAHLTKFRLNSGFDYTGGDVEIKFVVEDDSGTQRFALYIDGVFQQHISPTQQGSGGRLFGYETSEFTFVWFQKNFTADGNTIGQSFVVNVSPASAAISNSTSISGIELGLERDGSTIYARYKEENDPSFTTLKAGSAATPLDFLSFRFFADADALTQLSADNFTVTQIDSQIVPPIELADATPGVPYDSDFVSFTIANLSSPGDGNSFTINLEVASTPADDNASVSGTSLQIERAGTNIYSRYEQSDDPGFVTNVLGNIPGTVPVRPQIFADAAGESVNVVADNFTATGDIVFDTPVFSVVSVDKDGNLIQVTGVSDASGNVIERFDIIQSPQATYNSFLAPRVGIATNGASEGSGGELYIKINDTLYKYAKTALPLSLEDGSSASVTTTGEIPATGITGFEYNGHSVGGLAYIKHSPSLEGVFVHSIFTSTLNATAFKALIDVSSINFPFAWNVTDLSTLYFVDGTDLKLYDLNESKAAFVNVTSDKQVLAAGTQETATITAQVLNVYGVVKSNKSMTFTVSAGDGAISPAIGCSDVNGEDTTTYTVGSAVGTATITTTVSDITC